MPEKDADLDNDKSNETDQDVKVESESLKSLSFCQRMRALSPHHFPLKNQMRGKIVIYMDLLRSGSHSSESCKKCAKWK